MAAFQNCSPSFKSARVIPADFASVDTLDGKALYSQNCQQCHGPIETTAKLNRPAYAIRAATNEIPLMSGLKSLSDAQIEAITLALAGGAPPAPTPTPNPNPNATPSLAMLACTPGQTQKTPLLKLTNREFRNSLRALLDDFSTALKNDTELSSLLSAIPTDSVVQDRNTVKEQSLLNTQDITTAWFNAAFRAGALVSGEATGLRNYPNTNQCLNAATLTQVCHQTFVGELSRRAFRRAMPASEVTALADSLWDSTQAKAAQLQLTVTALIMMPEFGYKAFDMGTVSSVGNNTLDLTAHELASKMSFMLTGAPPDAALRALADDGQILNSAILSQQVDRLLALPASRDTVTRLFRESLGYDTYDGFQYPANFTNGVNTSGLKDAMTAELDNFFYDIVVTRRGSFQDLFSATSTSFNHTGLAAIYGVTNGATSLPNSRAGFLNRAAMLTKRSGYAASPIKRGLNVIEHVLCEEVGPPPPSAPTALPSVEGQVLTTRERTFRTTEVANSTCIACHGRFNSLGYALEGFDSFGRQRTVEAIFNTSGEMVAQLPVNTQSSSRQLASDGSEVSFADAVDMSAQLGRRDKAMMCFMKNLKRFETRVANTAQANCHMNQGLSVLYKANGASGTIADTIKAYIQAPEFRRWSY